MAAVALPEHPVQQGTDDRTDQRHDDEQQTCDSAVPPEISAGPRLRAGLTEVPSIGTATRCATTRARPIGMRDGGVRGARGRGQHGHHQQGGEHELDDDRRADAVAAVEASPQPLVPRPSADRLNVGFAARMP